MEQRRAGQIAGRQTERLGPGQTSLGWFRARGWLWTCLCDLSSRGFPQECTSGALRALSIIQVADFDLRGRGNLDAGAARRVHAVPQSRAELCADESLFELPCVPGPHHKTFLLGLKVNLQRCLHKPWPLNFPTLPAFVAKWAGLHRYLNLYPVEWSDPFA